MSVRITDKSSAWCHERGSGDRAPYTNKWAAGHRKQLRRTASALARVETREDIPAVKFLTTLAT